MVAACDDLGADSMAPRTRPPLDTLERLDASPPRAAPQRSCIVMWRWWCKKDGKRSLKKEACFSVALGKWKEEEDL